MVGRGVTPGRRTLLVKTETLAESVVDGVESALVYISEGYFGQVPETIHEKAAHLARLLASEHPYVDGNKRTALGAATMMYNYNGYEFTPEDTEIRRILKQFATDESEADMDAVVAFFEEHTNT